MWNSIMWTYFSYLGILSELCSQGEEWHVRIKQTFVNTRENWLLYDNILSLHKSREFHLPETMLNGVWGSSAHQGVKWELLGGRGRGRTVICLTLWIIIVCFTLLAKVKVWRQKIHPKLSAFSLCSTPCRFTGIILGNMILYRWTLLYI